MTAMLTGQGSRQVCYQAASLLLTYPDEALLERLPLLGQAVGEAGWGEYFAAVLDHLGSSSLVEAQSFHVAEFDTSRRHALHLSYWTDGDTRRRGEVLAGIKQVYRDSGLLVDLDGELPDHLPLVLEFAAAGDPERGFELLQHYRPSLELLRLQMERDQLPHAGILQALCATLPGPSPTSRAEVQAMVDAAMPTEDVGLDGYGAGPDKPLHAAAGPMPSAAESVETPRLRPGLQPATRPGILGRLFGSSKEDR